MRTILYALILCGFLAVSGATAIADSHDQPENPCNPCNPCNPNDDNSDNN